MDDQTEVEPELLNWLQEIVDGVGEVDAAALPRRRRGQAHAVALDGGVAEERERGAVGEVELLATGTRRDR